MKPKPKAPALDNETAWADPARIRAAVAKYVRDVDTGKTIAGDLVVRAVRRHLFDLKHQGKDPARWSFDEAAAIRVIRFFSLLRHWKGEWGPRDGKLGKIFELQPWQQFLLWVLFGWRRKDGTRRFRTGYIEVGRKNGKTPLIAGIGLYLLTSDGEAGAEIYSAATKKDQARIIVTDAAMMVKASPALRPRVVASGGRYINNLAYLATASKIEVLSKDSETQDGLNVFAGLVDELHAHKDRGLWDVLDSGTSARRQPLMLAITTAGSDAESIGGQLHDIAEKVLEGFDKKGGVKDEEFFAFVAAASKGDDPYSLEAMRKANPNLGVSVKLDDLQRKALRAKQFAGFRNEFFRKHLNLWTQAETAWLDLDQWDACQRPITREQTIAEGGWECRGGMDLAAKVDLTAFVEVFHKNGRYRIFPRFWMPQQRADEVRRLDKFYEPWLTACGAQPALIEVTDGAITDYDFVEGAIVAAAAESALVEVAFDPWNATQVAVHLRDQHGIAVSECRQGVASLNEPCREFERLIVGGLLEHDGNPVLRWMAGNVAVHTDSNGNIKPVKPAENSRKKIDGIAAAIMALGRFIAGDGGEAEMTDIPFVVAGTR